MDRHKTTTVAEDERNPDSLGRRVRALREGSRWKVVAILLGLVAVIVFWALLTKKKPAAEEEEALVVSVKVGKAKRGSIEIGRAHV